MQERFPQHKTNNMQLDYIHHMNAYGDNIVRLYDFDRSQATKFRQILEQTLLIDRKTLDLSSIDFIQPRNCNLYLRLAGEDLGIQSDDGRDFYCDLTTPAYKQMIVLLDPFCKRETKGYQWLYDVDSPIDFLFSPAGTW